MPKAELLLPVIRLQKLLGPIQAATSKPPGQVRPDVPPALSNSTAVMPGRVVVSNCWLISHNPAGLLQRKQPLQDSPQRAAGLGSMADS